MTNTTPSGEPPTPVEDDVITEPALAEPGTDELHALLLEAMEKLSGKHPVRVLWERLDEILTAGGPGCLPAPWDGDSEPGHTACEAKVGHVSAGVSRLRCAAIRSVHQRGHEAALPPELLEFLTGGVETAALAEPGALARDHFEVVNSALNSNCTVADGLRCTTCGAISTQAGTRGENWTLARIDLMADRHRCQPPVNGADVAGARQADISDLHGCMVDGYTPEDVNRVFRRIEDACGIRLVCLWDYYDIWGFGGDSQFYVESRKGRLYELSGDLWQWLNHNPAHDSTPKSPGAPATWWGSAADAAEHETDDGFYNRAYKNKD